MVLGVTAGVTKLLALLHVFDVARLRSVFWFSSLLLVDFVTGTFA